MKAVKESWKRKKALKIPSPRLRTYANEIAVPSCLH